MKHLVLILISIFFLAYKVIDLNTISNDGIIQSRAVLSHFVSEDTIDAINVIAEKSTAYKASLQERAITTEEDKNWKGNLTMVEFAKDNAIFVALVIFFVILFKIRNFKLILVLLAVVSIAFIIKFVSAMLLLKLIALFSLLYVFHKVATSPKRVSA